MAINIICWNVRGIMSSAYSLSAYLESYDIDVALITEHKLFQHSTHFLSCINESYAHIQSVDLTIDQYGSAKCGKGGTAILYKKSLKHCISAIPDIASNRITGIELRGRDIDPVYIFCVYMPSDNNVEVYKEVLSDLQALYSFYNLHGTVVFAGDFNSHINEK